MKRIFTSIAILLIILTGIGVAVFLKINRFLILSFISFSGLFCIIATWFIYKAFVDGVRKSSDFATAISEGRLTETLYLSSDDDVGVLAESLNRMTVELRLMIEEIKRSVFELSTLIEQSYKTSGLVITGTNNQTRSFKEMFLSIKALSEAIRISRESTESVLNLTEKAQNNASEGKQVLNKLLSEAESINSSSEQLTSIVVIMNEISEKTKLLALNAALNSSNDQTLASEIRKLSERISDNTRTIEKSIRTNLEIAKRTVAAVEEVNSSFNKIRNDVEDITRLAKDIQSTTQEELRESEKLIVLKNRVDEIAEENIRYINDLTEHTNSITEKIEVLKKFLSRFKTEES